jgi:hypothetical protein
MSIIIISQIDSLSNNEKHFLNGWLEPSTIIGIVTIIIIYLYRHQLNKMKPSFSNIEGIFDSYGNRLLFTIISKNPSGSRRGKLHISKQFILIFYIKRITIFYQIINEFLSKERGDVISKNLIKP